MNPFFFITASVKYTYAFFLKTKAGDNFNIHNLSSGNMLDAWVGAFYAHVTSERNQAFTTRLSILPKHTL